MLREKLLRPLKRVAHEARWFSQTAQERVQFILITKERSGSTVLMDILSRHPAIWVDLHDFYSPRKWEARFDKPGKVFSRKPVRGVKFKICNDYTSISQQEQTDFIHARHEHGVRLVRLHRKTYLRQALSFIMTGQTRKLHYHHDCSERIETFALDVPKFIDAATYYRELSEREACALEGVPHCYLSYEDVLESPDGKQRGADACFQFLGLPSVPVDTSYKKPSRPQLRSLISNYAELEESLASLPWADIGELA